MQSVLVARPNEEKRLGLGEWEMCKGWSARNRENEASFFSLEAWGLVRCGMVKVWNGTLIVPLWAYMNVGIYSFIYSSIFHRMFIEQSPPTRYCSRCLGYISEKRNKKTNKETCLCRTYIYTRRETQYTQ